MALNIAIQMNHISTVDIETDSTFALAIEAENRGYNLFHYLPEQLSYLNGQVLAKASSLKVRRKVGDHFTLKPPQLINLVDMDVILLRQDPPFDMSYITTTHILEQIHPKNTGYK